MQVRIYIYLCFVFCCCQASLMAQTIVLNEIMADNENTILDEDGDASDWIELYNRSGISIDMGGWTLSDEEGNVLKWTLPPIVLNPDEYLLIFASGKNRQHPNSPLHTNFKISAAGEAVFLYDATQQLVDMSMGIELNDDQSYGRFPDGSENWLVFDVASPNVSNAPSVSESEWSTLSFSHEEGWYSTPIELEVVGIIPDVTIRYTSNGTIPTKESTIWKNPTRLEQPTTQEDLDAQIETSADFWFKPKGDVFQIQSLQFAGYLDSVRITPIYSKNFLIHPLMQQKYVLPIVSLQTDSIGLFSAENGIYVAGNAYEEGALYTGNYHQRGRDWERIARLSYFDSDGILGLSQDVGIRIHGQFSRQLPQKSLRLYARTEYGEKKLNYPFFATQKPLDEYKRLVLRSINPNLFHVPFKDELCHLLVREMGLDYQAFQPVIAFVNGEYWGIHNLKERHDERYIANNYNVDDDTVDFLEGNANIVVGDNTDFLALLEELHVRDIAQDEQYEWIAQYIEIDNFIDFVVAETYFSMRDFPINNTKFWKSDAYDGKWRWLFNDGDLGMNEYWRNRLGEWLSPINNVENHTYFVILLQHLFKNTKFQQQLYQRNLYHLNNTLHPRNVISKIDSLQQIYDPLMPEHIRRWGYPSSLSLYHSSIAQIREFATLRPAAMLDDLENLMNIPFRVYPNPTSDLLYIDGLEIEDETVFYQIFDMTGQLIQREYNLMQLNQISCSALSVGCYVLEVLYYGKRFRTKIIKM